MAISENEKETATFIKVQDFFSAERDRNEVR